MDRYRRKGKRNCIWLVIPMVILSILPATTTTTSGPVLFTVYYLYISSNKYIREMGFICRLGRHTHDWALQVVIGLNSLLHSISEGVLRWPHLCVRPAQWRANQKLKGLCCSDLGIKVLIEMTVSFHGLNMGFTVYYCHKYSGILLNIKAYLYQTQDHT